MASEQGQCPECEGWWRLASGVLPWHQPLNAPVDDTRVCIGVGSAPKADGDYPVGFDSDPWVYNGGLPELGKHR